MSVSRNIFDAQKEIGERIKSERKRIKKNRKSMTQEQLAEYLDRDRTTVINWENGKSCPTIAELRKLGLLFHCDVQYLLGEQECRTREQADMQEALDLSKKAIENICQLREDNTDMQRDGTAMFALNKLLESPNIQHQLTEIGLFLQNIKMRDTESMEYFESEAYRKEVHEENQSLGQFIGGGRVTIKNSQYQEYLEQHMTRVFMDFLHSVAQQVDKENDYILVSEKED